MERGKGALAKSQPDAAAAAAIPPTNDRSRSHAKRRATGNRSESGKRSRMDPNFYLEYQKNVAILSAMGMSLEQQLLNEKDLTEEQILVKQKKVIEWYRKIHQGGGRAVSAPPPGTRQ